LGERDDARGLQLDQRHRDLRLSRETVSAPPGARLRLAVDAGALARDRRGMGRVARGVLRVALADPNVTVTLLAQSRNDERALANEFPRATVARAASAKRRGRYDVVWFPFNGMRYAAAAPALVTINDAFAFTEPHTDVVARWREQAPIRRAARRAARVQTISTWSRGEIARALRLDPDEIAVVRPSPDPFWFPALDDALPAGLAGARFALLVGVREPRKNAHLALEACARAFEGRDALLAVVGELDARDRAYARRVGLRAGEIAASDETLRALYRNAHVVLVPSLVEGFGMVAIEAMACGAPVFASNASALPEATAGAALLLDPRDPHAWAAALRAHFDDPARATALRARAAARFAFADRDEGGRALLSLLGDVARSARP
jgi:glycosyltransferase involved in cell wall biosynthesis